MKNLGLLILFVSFATLKANANPLDLSWSDQFLFTESLQTLATVTNDRGSDVSTLSIALSGSAVSGMRFENVGADGKADRNDFTLAQIQSQDGVVLAGEQGHKAIILHGTVDSAAGSGSLRVSILANGLTGNYKDCKGNLNRDSAGTWHLVNAYTNQVVDHLAIKTWTFGISTIEGLCPASMIYEIEE